LFLGSGITLTEMAIHPQIRNMYPALADAAGLVAGPQLRNMGTLGGNICLETRCVYYNQTFFWRDALGYCLKKDGDECHVIPGGSRCVAAFSADTPGPLLVYGATVHLRSVRGEREVPAGEFFRADGVRNTVREPDELVTGVTLPAPAPGLQSGYFKFRIRNSIDFPALSVAAAARVQDDTFQSLGLVVGALGARPRVVSRLEELVRGQKLSPSLVEEIGSLVFQQCRPLTNINVDTEWRRSVLPVFVQRTLENLKPSTS
jgi:4-hydroxybenzoyl-CoA reductase subunit beta